MSIPFLPCMAATAAFYHLPPRVLPSIQAVEGGRPGLIQFNANGSVDLGLMQVNTLWVAPIARFARIPKTTVVIRLVNDACFNIAAAGWIMRIYMDEAKDDLMVAIGYYHSHTPALRSAYQEKVQVAARMLFSRLPNQHR